MQVAFCRKFEALSMKLETIPNFKLFKFKTKSKLTKTVLNIRV